MSRISRVISDISTSNVDYAEDLVKFPETLQKKCYAMPNFRSDLGCIDETNIPIRTPCKHEHLFINSKNFHLINAQSVCDFYLRFTNLVEKWLCSSHDLFIWTDCNFNEVSN